MHQLTIGRHAGRIRDTRHTRRPLRLEHLEDRRLLAVLGADPADSPSAAELYEFLDTIPPSPTGAVAYIQPADYTAFELDRAGLGSFVSGAPSEFTDDSQQTPYHLSIPAPDGSLQSFEIFSAPVMAPELAAEFPEIQTYRGQGVDDDAASLRFDLTPQGFHAQVLSPHGTYYIDPYYHLDDSVYVSYWRTDFALDPAVQRLRDQSLLPDDIASVGGHDGNHEHDEGGSVLERTGDTLRTYRLATAATGEYTTFHGGTVADGQAAIVTAVNRVTGVYEVELTVRMELVPNNSDLVYTNGATDPYTNSNGVAMLSQNQSVIDSVIGNANYDIGHVFSTGGGGVASLGVVGVTGSKARGVTGLSSPIGDPFYIDFVAHEMGHQYGASHTFNGSVGSCGSNRTSSSAYEPGSGSTIMAYAGICGSDNLQNSSDPYFHFRSLDQILRYLDVTRPFVGTRTSTGNNQPLANAGPNYAIPADTPFRLVGAGSDPDSGDVLTYNWEERDLGPQQPLSQPDNGRSPIIRSYSATTDNTRIVPRLPNLLNNTSAKGEKLPSEARTMRFRLTVRDNRSGAGGVDTDDMQISVIDTGMPFRVTNPNTGSVNWVQGTTETVTWNVAGTDSGSINTPQVNILLSTDGGQTFPTVLASNVPNNGSHDVIVPGITTTQARIMVEGAGNIFFDISNANFRIAGVDNTPPDATSSPADVTAAGGTNYTFTVTYTDDVAIDSSDIGNGDVEIIAPDQSVLPALFVTKSTSLDTSPITATYVITPPGGTWDSTDNGVYTVRTVAGGVTDTSDNPIAAMDVGTFQVNVPPLGSSCTNPAPAGILGDGFSDLIYNPLNGVLSYRIDSTNFPDDGILEFQITGPQPLGPAAGAPTFGMSSYANGTQHLTMPVTGGSPGLERDLPLLQYATLLVPGDFDCSHFVSVGDSSAQTIFTTVATSGDNAPFIFSAAPDITTAGGTNHTFDVILIDDLGIEVADVTTGVMRVNGPNGYDEVATVLSVVPGVNSPSVTASVSIPAAGGTWDASDQGTYTVNVEPYAITDVNNNFFPGGSVGTFDVNIPGTAPGDFDQDGDLDCDDVNALTTAISTGSPDLTFDVTGDNQVNAADLDEWILNLKGTLFGDANLDFQVDGSDFGIWNGAKFLTGTAWCTGDFNADGQTDGSDFGIWNANKFQMAARQLPAIQTLPDLQVRERIVHDLSARTTDRNSLAIRQNRPRAAPAAIQEWACDDGHPGREWSGAGLIPPGHLRPAGSDWWNQEGLPDRPTRGIDEVLALWGSIRP